MPISISVTPGQSNNSNNPVKYEYTSSATWTKPTDPSFYGVLVVCAGAGSGGGGGRRGAASTMRSAGAGGGGGALGVRFIPASNLSGSHQITIGAGGTGGVAATTNDTDGGAGGSAGNTSFGNFLVAPGGQGIPGGSTTSTLGGNYNSTQYTASVPLYGYHFLGSVGGNTSTSNSAGQVGSIGGYNALFGSGGGSGVSIRSTNSTTGAGGNGGDFYYSGSIVASYGGNYVLGGTGGAVGVFGASGATGSNVPVQLSAYIFDMFLLPSVQVGSGGGGGRCGDTTGTTAAGNGGNGGRCAGGGGGGASTNGANSGAGGNGGDGFCIVLELYGR